MAEDAELTPESPPAGREDYADLGGRIAGILNAAETAAAEIRADAERAADEVRRNALAETEAYSAGRRREADAEAGRIRDRAATDAAALREAVSAAAQRISEEGTRTLEQLRSEARTLEGRFEKAVDHLRGLVSQLENVAFDAGAHPPEDRSTARDEAESDEAEQEPPVGAWDEPDPADADRATLSEDLSTRVARDPHRS